LNNYTHICAAFYVAVKVDAAGVLASDGCREACQALAVKTGMDDSQVSLGAASPRNVILYQNGGMLVLAYQGCSGKWLLNVYQQQPIYCPSQLHYAFSRTQPKLIILASVTDS